MVHSQHFKLHLVCRTGTDWDKQGLGQNGQCLDSEIRQKSDVVMVRD